MKTIILFIAIAIVLVAGGVSAASAIKGVYVATANKTDVYKIVDGKYTCYVASVGISCVK